MRETLVVGHGPADERGRPGCRPSSHLTVTRLLVPLGILSGTVDSIHHQT